MITVSVAGSETGRLAAESCLLYTSDAAEAVGHGRRLLAVVDGRRHRRWRRVHVHQHHGATLAATALALRQKDLRVQFLQLRLAYTRNLIAVNDRKSLSLHFKLFDSHPRGRRSLVLPVTDTHTHTQTTENNNKRTAEKAGPRQLCPFRFLYLQFLQLVVGFLDHCRHVCERSFVRGHFLEILGPLWIGHRNQTKQSA